MKNFISFQGLYKVLLPFAIVAGFLAIGYGIISGNWLPAFVALGFPFLLPKDLNLGTAELLKRLFLAEIQPVLFPAASFMSRAKNDDAYVNNNTVELPNSGTIPAVQVDRTSLPATIAKRTDTAANYQLNELTTDPTLIQDSEALIVAYDKRMSVLDQHVKQINFKAANRFLNSIAGSASVTKIVTTGASRAVDSKGGVETGTRKALTIADLTNVKQQFHKQDVTQENEDVMGIAVLPYAMYNDLLQIAQFTQYLQYGAGAVVPSGVIARAFGFDFYVRSQVNINAKTTGAGSIGALAADGAAEAVDDCQSALFWHPDYVRRAKGAPKIYIQTDKPEYYGSIFSCMLRCGFIAARADGKGVVSLTETWLT